jgi:predicted Zn-dependent peptidase
MKEDTRYDKTILDNHLTIVTEHIPAVKSVSIGIWIQTGSRNEKYDQNGIAHFIEHMVFKGTKNRTAEEIAQSLESVGGHLNAFTGKELTCYYAKILDEHVPKAVDVLADIVFNPLFLEEDIEKEKLVVLEEIKNLDDTPDEMIHDFFSQTLFEPHPLSWPILGIPKNIKSFSVGDLYSYMKNQYSTNKMVIAAAGNLEHSDFAHLIHRSFSCSNFKEENGISKFSRIRPRTDIHSKDIAQAHLCVGTRGYPFEDNLRFPLLVLSTLLGGGMSSRLFQHIREREGLTYSIYTFFDFFFDTGLFGVYAGMDASTVRQVLSMVLRELHDLVSTPISDEELTRTKSQLKGNLMLGLESTSNRMMRLARLETYLREYSTLDETVADIDRVTAEEIQTLAKDLFDSQKLAITILGPVEDNIIRQDALN